MITPDDLNTAVAQAGPLLRSLGEFYETLPETTCRCDTHAN